MKLNIKYCIIVHNNKYNMNQWRRKVCKNAERPSIMRRMVTVRMAHGVNTINTAMGPSIGLLELTPRPIEKTMFHNTSESSESVLSVVLMNL